MATPGELARFHDARYIQAVMDAEADQDLDPVRRSLYGIGEGSNPIFAEIFSRPATACGASLYAVRLLQDVDIVYNPAGGTHHGRADRASGFCYFNDPVLCLLALLDAGARRIAYVDLDAHHGDGVQDALDGDSRVLVISAHEANRWPRTGQLGDRGLGNARNIPLPAETNDTEYQRVTDHGLVPLVSSFVPDVVLIQGGADAVLDDPLSRLALSNQALWGAVRALRGLAPKLIVLGGGGYNPWTVGRCWAGVWATLTDRDPSSALTAESLEILAGLSWERAAGKNPKSAWLTRLHDDPLPGPVRADVERAIASVMLP